MANIWSDIVDTFLGGGIPSSLDPLNPAASIESGFVALIRDIWKVIAGPVEILLGAFIIVATLGLAFKNDIMTGLGPLAAGAMI